MLGVFLNNHGYKQLFSLKYLWMKFCCNQENLLHKTFDTFISFLRFERRPSFYNAWSNKKFLYYLKFRMLQHTSWEVNGLQILGLFLIILAGLSLSFRFSLSQRSEVVFKASCWDCGSFYVGKTKQRLYDMKTEHFKTLTQNCHASAVADHVISTGHNIKWGILKSSLLESPFYSVKSRKLFRSVSWNPHLMKTWVARSYFFINYIAVS